MLICFMCSNINFAIICYLALDGTHYHFIVFECIPTSTDWTIVSHGLMFELNILCFSVILHIM